MKEGGIERDGGGRDREMEREEEDGEHKRETDYQISGW